MCIKPQLINDFGGLTLDYKIIEVKQSIFEDNDADAERLRQEIKEDNTFLINLMSSPGSGKTTTLCRTINGLKDEMKIGVMEADIDSDVDAATVTEAGARAIQIHTGGMCHLDADMTRQGLHELGTSDLDLVFLENVGNLVCPAEFDTGSTANVMILSVPEGDDKPYKYPLMFSVCDVILVNKCDTLEVFTDFSKDRVVERIHELNPKAKVIFISAKTGEGFDEWIQWLRGQVADYRS
jgi:hydrogenase nickel incorporation protein HypB